MGQAMVDLPDPANQPNAAAAHNADDLLSQLAGAEIDRLLADASMDESTELDSSTDFVDAPSGFMASPAAEKGGVIPEHAAVAPPVDLPDPSVSIESSDALDSAIADSIDPLLDASQSTHPQSPAEPTVAADTSHEVSSQLDDAFKAMNEPQPPADAAVGMLAVEPANRIDAQIAAGATALLPTPTVDALKAEAASVSEETETSTDERAALAAMPGEPSPAAEGNIETLLAAPLETTPIPFFLKPLVWINAPFNFVPDSARNTLGKAAIVTLINALSVLIYVAIFRKHHRS